MSSSVKGKTREPPSNTLATTKNKYIKGGRKGRCLAYNKFGHYTRECPNTRDTSLDDDNNHSKGIFNDRKNDRYNGKGKKNASHQGNGRLFKKARNSRYEESNVDSDKKKEYYLILALSTTSPLDSLGIWLVDSSTSRHFIDRRKLSLI